MCDIILTYYKKERGAGMKVKSKFLEIVLVVAFIAIMSFAIINIKNMIQQDESASLTDAADIAKTLEESTNPVNPTQPNDEKEGKEEVAVANNAIAVIDIPSVGIRGQVKEGTDDANIKNYIGKFKGCANPGENGNFSVAAHNNIYTEIFRNLHKIKVNDEIRVITKTHEYIYSARSITKIDPTQIEVLTSNPNRKEITLITCSDMAKYRIAVKGDLISQKSI